jgi:hypothetical protein
MHDAVTQRPKGPIAALLSLAHNLPSVSNATGANTRTKPRIAHILVWEGLIDLDAKRRKDGSRAIQEKSLVRTGRDKPCACWDTK